MTYNASQFRTILPFLPKEPKPKWFVIGGPADGDEARCAVEEFPEIKVLGCEPNAAMYEWQIKNAWPRGSGPLIGQALSDGWGFATLRSPDDEPRCSSLMADRRGDPVCVGTTTLDYLDSVYGPFSDALLWLDVEGWEVPVLEGGRELFGREAVIACNVEVIHRRLEAQRQLEAFFAEFGFRLAYVWNEQPGLCEDRVYVRGDLE